MLPRVGLNPQTLPARCRLSTLARLADLLG